MRAWSGESRVYDCGENSTIGFKTKSYAARFCILLVLREVTVMDRFDCELRASSLKRRQIPATGNRANGVP
jgi:hypothetical protein